MKYEINLANECFVFGADLYWSTCGVALWKHGNDDVGTKPLPQFDLVHYFSCYFRRNSVMAICVIILKPAVCRPEKILKK